MITCQRHDHHDERDRHNIPENKNSLFSYALLCFCNFYAVQLLPTRILTPKCNSTGNGMISYFTNLPKNSPKIV